MNNETKFCPYCSDENSQDGSYQAIGCFSILERFSVHGVNNEGNHYYDYLECPLCSHKEEIEVLKCK